MLRSTMISVLSSLMMVFLVILLVSFISVTPPDSREKRIVSDTSVQKLKVVYQFLHNRKNINRDWQTKGLSLKEFPEAVQIETTTVDSGADAENRYEVRDLIVYLVKGSRPLDSLRSQTEVVSLKPFKKLIKASHTVADKRLVIHVRKVIRINTKGEEFQTPVTSGITSVKISD